MQMTLKERVKALIVETLMLQMSSAELRDDQTLFGPGSLGLDSVDALQLVVMLDKNFGLKIVDSNAARETLASVNSIIAAVEKHQTPPA
jgi:acyl carrier protein